MFSTPEPGRTEVVYDPPTGERAGQLGVAVLPAAPGAVHRAVTVWRKLKRLGVARLGDGLVALPGDARTREQLDWIAEEIIDAGGKPPSGWPGPPPAPRTVRREPDVRRVAPRNTRAVTAEADQAASHRGAATGAQRRAAARGTAPHPPPRLLPTCPQRDTARLAVETLRPRAPKPAAGSTHVKWATRTGVHIDRAACAWLIRRFIDADAEFVFLADPAAIPADATPLRHARRRRLRHHHGRLHASRPSWPLRPDRPRAVEIAHIVHEADLDDERYDAPEAPGLDIILRGLIHGPHRPPDPHPHRTGSSTASTSTTAGPHCWATNPHSRRTVSRLNRHPPGPKFMTITVVPRLARRYTRAAVAPSRSS